MSFDKEIKLPGIGGIDSDSSDILIAPNDSREIVNCRILGDEDGYNNIVRNLKGTLSLYVDSLFNEDAGVIGTARNDESNSIIFFVGKGTSGGKSGILEFSLETNTVSPIWVDTDDYSLNLSVNHRIRGAYVIDGKLYWNDGYNPPRKINIEKTKAGQSLDEQTVSLIKFPYFGRIDPKYDTDSNKSTNNLRGKLFQFRVAYIYQDKEISVASPISICAIPKEDVVDNGEPVGDLKRNNVIKFDVNTGHYTVDKIVVYVREGNIGDWGKVETIDKDEILAKGLIPTRDNAVLTYSFYNDVSLVIEDQNDINRLYDTVPLVTDYMGYIHTNQLLLAGMVEGYDNINTDITLDYSIHGSSSYTVGNLVKTWDVVDNYTDDNYFHATGSVIKNVNQLPSAGHIVRISIDDVQKEFIVTSDDAASYDNFSNHVISFIIGNFELYEAENSSEVEGFDDYTIFVYSDPNNVIPTVTMKEYEATENSFTSVGSFKSGSDHIFGIVYYDKAGRSSFVQGKQKIYIPFVTEITNWPADMPAPHKHGVKFGISWEINHTPPDWAVKYQWVRTDRTDVLSFVRYIIKGVQVGTDANADKMLIDITPLNHIKDQSNSTSSNGLDYSFPNSVIPAYEFQKGDRVRFITKSKTDFSTESGLGDILDYYLDMEILGYETDSNGDPTESILVQKFDTSTYPNIGENTLIEIYTPNKEKSTSIFYEMGNLYDIYTDTNGNKLHRGGTQDQTTSQPAKGDIEHGDVYMTPTVFDRSLAATTNTKIVESLESMFASNFYESRVYSIGRPNIENKEFKQQKKLTIRVSDKYYEDTNINGLSKFTADKDLFVSSEFGNEITGVYEVGFTLKVLQRKKVTSFYIGRTGLQLASSSSTDQLLANSDAALSTKSPADELRGCSSPESMIVVGRNVYFADILNEKITRDSANGIGDIDGYSLKKDLSDAFKYIKGFDDYEIIASYNPKVNEVGFTFVSYEGSNRFDYGTFYFKETVNRWTGKVYYDKASVPPVAFANMNNRYFAFLGKDLWELEVTNEYNKFFGEQKDAYISLVFNKFHAGVKLFRVLEINGKGDWYCPEEGDISIRKEHSALGRNQTSRLNKNRFKKVGTVKSSTFLKDMHGLGVVGLYKGSDLRGDILNVKLVNKDITLATIEKVGVTYQILKTT